MRVYAVMKISNKIDVQGITSELPKGEYFIPVFKDRDKAEEHSANGKYEIMEMKVPRKDSKKKYIVRE